MTIDELKEDMFERLTEFCEQREITISSVVNPNNRKLFLLKKGVHYGK